MIQGDFLRDEGIERVSVHNRNFLEAARYAATILCEENGTATSDQVRIHLDNIQMFPDHPNAYGAIFKDKRFEPCGWTKSKIPSNHSRYIRVWKLK